MHDNYPPGYNDPQEDDFDEIDLADNFDEDDDSSDYDDTDPIFDIPELE